MTGTPCSQVPFLRGPLLSGRLGAHVSSVCSAPRVSRPAVHGAWADGLQHTLRARSRSAHLRPVALHRAWVQGCVGSVPSPLAASGRARLWASFGRGAAQAAVSSDGLAFPMGVGSGSGLHGGEGTVVLVPFAPPGGLAPVVGVPMAAS